ncbi:Ig-like domain-containing protein [Macrococcoides canis]|uniref:Ig-like domain-containing protein n=1 Tax=Macrococcoides canis TaxID=1855823 RepID=UPI0020B6E08C|nr:Ig-like domain-containing protein [Macrococcus canis]UTH06716.1 LPXTG cell wall anchor domain-containing protein [Macrococcus canis]
MYQKLKIFLVIILSFAYSGISPALVAQAQTAFGDELVTNVTMTNSAGQNIEGQTVDVWDNLNVNYEFSLPDGQVKQGDTMTLKLPPELILLNNVSLPVKDTSGNIVGNAVADKNTGLITVTFTDYVETHNGVSGFINVWTYFNKKVVSETGQRTIQLTANAQVHVDVTGSIGTDPAEQLNKWGTVDSDDSSIIHWTIRANYANKYMNKMAITDTIGEGQELLKDTFIITEVTYVDAGATEKEVDWANSTRIPNDTILFDQDGKTFSLVFENTDKSYYIKYDTKITDPTLSIAKNYIKADLDGKTFDWTVNTRVEGGSGGAVGYENASVIVKKVDENQKPIISDTTRFALYKEDGTLVSENLSTDRNGIVSVENLLPGNYYFVETSAPTGYTMDASPLNFTIEAQQTKYVELSKVNVSIPPTTEEPTTEEPTTEEPTTEEPTTEEPTTEEPTTEEPTTEEPTTEEPTTEEPTTEEPTTEEPTTEEPTTEEPTTEEPTTEEPTTEEPTTEEPTTEEPTTEEPTTEEPTTEEPTTEEPTTEEPTTEEPTTEEPTTEEPTTEEPTTEEPTTEEPTTEEPTTEEPTTEEPTTEEPTTEEPTTEEPTTEEPTTEEPTTEEPTTEETTTEEPTTEEPTTEEPTTEEPTTEEPTTEEPTTEEPTTEEPTTEEPTTEEPTTEEPTTEVTTTEKPTTKTPIGEKASTEAPRLNENENKNTSDSPLPTTGEHNSKIIGIIALFLLLGGMLLLFRKRI